ncbi:MAG TPA: hypothetical protein VMW75_08995 [Thermoanaerobaculia bacterium]|nr:hypothetical protein [Thermoanaerobaculia bacterium]
MKVACFSLAALFAFLGCQKPPAAPPAVPATYTVRIELSGLIGFAKGLTLTGPNKGKEDGTVWAFLANAAYNPEKSAESDLPPGFFAEQASRHYDSQADRMRDLNDLMPPHYAWIRLHNAAIVTTDPAKKFDPEKGRSIAGGDIRFRPKDLQGHAPAGPVTADLCQLSDISPTAKALSSEKKQLFTLGQLRALDELDPALLSAKLDKRLAARVLVKSGVMQTRVHAHLHGATEGFDNRVVALRYKTGSSQCLGKQVDGVELATEVDVEHTGLSGDFQIDIAPGDSILFHPADWTKPAVIEIFNDIREMRDNLKIDPPLRYVDAQAYRWYYRLVPQPAQNDVPHHYFPCSSDKGPPKCYMKYFYIDPARLPG